MDYSLSPLPEQSDFGVVVTGFKPEMLDDESVRKELYDLWIDKGLVVFRETDGLETQLKLSEVFGECDVHPLLREADISRENKISVNIVESDGAIFEVDGEERAGWLDWHKDSIYTDAINHGGLLWSVTVPERGGETGFIDQIAAYDTLPDDLKERCEKLNVIYRYSLDGTDCRFSNWPVRRVSLNDFQKSTTEHYLARPRVIHPMVYMQERTGRKVINVPRQRLWHRFEVVV